MKNEREQWVGCSLCGEQVELRRRTMANPETVLLMMEELTRDHAGCEEYKHDPRMAAIARGVKLRTRRELGRVIGGGHAL